MAVSFSEDLYSYCANLPLLPPPKNGSSELLNLAWKLSKYDIWQETETPPSWHKLWSSPSRKTERGSERCFIKWRCHFLDYIASLVREKITSTEHWWNDTTKETRSSRRKPCPSITLFPTNTTWAGLGSSPCLRCERPALTAWDKARPLFVLFCLQDRPTHHLSRMIYLLLFLNQSRLIQW